MNAADVRRSLEAARARGEPFDRAWARAVAPLRAEAGGHERTVARLEARAWLGALEGTREAWRRGYSRVDSPEAESVAALEAA